MVDKVSKDRTSMFANIEEPFQLTEETGKQILDRCESGAEVIPEPKQETAEELPTIELERFRRALDAIDDKKTTVDELLKRFTLSQEQKDIILLMDGIIGLKGVIWNQMKIMVMHL